MELIVRDEGRTVVIFRGEPIDIPFARLPEAVLGGLDAIERAGRRHPDPTTAEIIELRPIAKSFQALPS